MNRTLRFAVSAAAAGAVVSTLVLPSGPVAAKSKDATLQSYAADTWRSMAAMADPGTGLVSDNIGADLSPASRAEYTSPTNIGAYMWSAIAARETKLITAAEARRRIATTLQTLPKLEKHEPSGMYYNWYDPKTGAKLTAWPIENEDGGHDTVYPFVSSVDNGWLATGLQLVIAEIPPLREQAHRVLDRMDFGYYYDPAEKQIRGGFWDGARRQTCSIPGNYRDGPPVYYTCHHYGAFNTEPRMASYLGIAAQQIPQEHYFGTWRTFPDDTATGPGAEQRPVGHYETYLGQQVFEGTYGYRGMRMVPTWGGSMFEALMVPLFVPEEQWGTQSWALNHPTYVQAQIEHGMNEAKYGYWGFSPSNNPSGGYREYGVDPIGMEPNGYASDQERTIRGLRLWRTAQAVSPCRSPLPTARASSRRTRRSSPTATRRTRPWPTSRSCGRNFDAYGAGGFYDAINVTTGEVSKRYLSLDQGMVMAALGNALAGDIMRQPFSHGPMEQRVAPLMRMEEFSGVTGQ